MESAARKIRRPRGEGAPRAEGGWGPARKPCLCRHRGWPWPGRESQEDAVKKVRRALFASGWKPRSKRSRCKNRILVIKTRSAAVEDGSLPFRRPLSSREGATRLSPALSAAGC